METPSRMIPRLLIAAFAILAAADTRAEHCVDAISENRFMAADEPARILIPPAGIMVRIPGGDFCMGDISGNGESDELPVHAVHVDAFWLATHEVTRKQFQRFVADTQYVSDAERDDSVRKGCLAVDPEKWTFKYRAGFFWGMSGFEQDDTHPVVCVSHDDTVAYITWLNQKTGRSFRLPTEAEWEYAARAGRRTVYPWGDSVLESCNYGNVADRNVWPGHTKSPFGRIDCDDGYAFTAPVGSYRANLLGIFDLSGNAWEWTSDCWGKNYGVEHSGEVCGLRSFRGSSWMNSEKSLRSANRSKNSPSARLNTVGFRLAIDILGLATDENSIADRDTESRE